MLDNAVALLSALGRTADEVAAGLRAAGVRGRPRESSCCPLAVFLRGRLPGRELSVGTTHVILGMHGHEVMPEGCRDFVLALDHGSYPDLLAPAPAPAEEGLPA
jgi:hypothetical protein